MDFTLYNILIDQLPDKPDLSVVKQRQLLPERWPVVLSGIEKYRKQFKHFVISDGQHDVLCFVDLPELVDAVTSLELGSIIHIVGSEPVFHDELNHYVLKVHQICTLKEYHDFVETQYREEQERQAWLAAQQPYYPMDDAMYQAYP
jgi:hypothetical protein